MIDKFRCFHKMERNKLCLFHNANVLAVLCCGNIVSELRYV